jgi:site-specific DNA recombinase
MKKAVIYLRVSTEDQVEKGFSLQAQRFECLAKSKELNCDEVVEFCDEGVSGSILERPMLLIALETIKQNPTDYFICYDPSRLSRNVSHQLILIDNIKKHKTKLIFVRSSFEDTAEGRFQITIMAAVDEYERARLKIRTELGKRAKAYQKLLTHNPNIYGYIFDKETDTLTINEKQAEVVKMMYTWLLEENLGPSKIADRLNEYNIPSMRDKLWSRVSTNRILKNYSYTGTLYIRRYDARDYKLNKFKKKDEKVSVTEKPREQWIGIEIPAIIEKQNWEKAKTLLYKSNRIFKMGEKPVYLLSGLLKCGSCGGTISGKTVSKNNITKNSYYCCINKYNYDLAASERCKSTLYKADELEEAIINEVYSWILNKVEIEKLYNTKIYYKEQMDKAYSMPSNDSIDIHYLMKLIQGYISDMSTNKKNRMINSLIKDITIEENNITIKAFIPNNIIKEF